MNASAREEYQRQRKDDRVRRGYHKLVGPDPVRANALYNAYQSEYRDHEIPILPSRPGTSNHVENTTVKKESPMSQHITINDRSAAIWRTFACTGPNTHVIKKALRNFQSWKLVGEKMMRNPVTGNKVRFVGIQSPQGNRFLITFDRHCEFPTMTAYAWMLKDGKPRKINLYGGEMGWAKNCLLRDFGGIKNPNDPRFSLHGAHHLVLVALLLSGEKLNIATVDVPEAIADRRIRELS